MKAEHLRRYRDITKLLVKYGFFELVRMMGWDDVLEKRPQFFPDNAVQGEDLTSDLEQLGPTFVKLGQFLSTRPDVLPAEYVRAMERLQSNVGSFPYDQVRDIVETELGMKVEEAYRDFAITPIAAASIGQVHRAVTRDGRTVAVKVQRPGIRDRVLIDLEVLGEVADLAQARTEFGRIYAVGEMFQEFRSTLLRELDYLQEMTNTIILRNNLRDFEEIVIPDVIEALTTSRVLTMDFIEGKKITLLSEDDKARVDTGMLLEGTFRAYLKQILVDGFFHADPHPGNVLLTPNGRIAVIDLGMVGRIAPGLREKLIGLLLAISEGQPEDAADIASSIGDKTATFDLKTYRRSAIDLLSRYEHASLSQVHVGTLVMEFTEVSRECGIRVPRELTMLGKTLLHLDQVAKELNPYFDPIASVRQYGGEIILRHVTSKISVGNVLRTLLDTKSMAGRLSRAMTSVLDRMADNELEVKVHGFDETRFIAGMQKIANRITLGLLFGSLIVGAGLFSMVPTVFTIFGYPALAIVFFLMAAVGAVWLIFDILYYDERPRTKK
ncbi:MAG: AarF/UbiB family protein [Desulfomonilaceae bacterium]|nr:AarF/UbiB family protein [Desulfomonilaceae bacterium]